MWLWLVLFHFGYFVVLCSALGLWKDFDSQHFGQVNRGWFERFDVQVPQVEANAFARHFATWDAEHYLLLSNEGYRKGVPSCAFYPLWPVTIRWCSVLVGGDRLLAGMILANLFSVAGWMLFYQVAAKRFGPHVAGLALILLIIFPGSLFYHFLYSESLFFLLVMLLWFGLKRERYGLAWVAAFLLPMTRAVGVFCLLPIGWDWLRRRPWEWLDRWRWLCGERGEAALSGGGHTLGRRGWAAFLADYALLVAPVGGLGCYFTLMWSWTGNPFEGLEAQKFWGAHSVSHLWDLPRFVMGFCEPTTWHDFQGSVLDRCAFLLLVYSLPGIWRLGKDMLVWTYVLGILPAMSGTFVSCIRFESMAFPMFIALAAFFLRHKSRWPLIAFVIMLSGVHLVLLWRFVNFRWAG